ncbi:MAG: diacylglycerol kinase family protein [Terracidiphilus sp.]
MRQVAVIYNPASGQSSLRRAKDIQQVLSVLAGAGVQAHAMETDAPGRAAEHAKEAIRLGCEAVLACGGDGTVHEVIQELVGSQTALGVIPMGTANALAQDLELGRSPLKAVRTLLDADPVQVPVGRIHFVDRSGAEQSRYFTVAAGIGADARLMSTLDAGLKRRFGYVLYLVEAARIWLTNSFPLFRAAFRLTDSEEDRNAEVSQVLGVRVRSFGGALGQLAPGATLHSESLRLIVFKTRSRYRYLRFLLAVLTGSQSFTGPIELLDVVSVECSPSNGSTVPILVEADGEVLGTLPARLDMAEQSLTLLIPPSAQP